MAMDRREKVEISLDFPVQLADRKLEKVTMRRPLVRDMVKHNVADGSVAEIVALIADLCGLVPDEVELMDTCDFEKLTGQLLAFRGVPR